MKNNINNELILNNIPNRNMINDLYSQALRSKSTGNFIKLKSAHIKSPKNNMNQLLNSNNNLKWLNEEENKIFLKNNKINKIELFPVSVKNSKIYKKG